MGLSTGNPLPRILTHVSIDALIPAVECKFVIIPKGNGHLVGESKISQIQSYNFYVDRNSNFYNYKTINLLILQQS